MSVAGPLGRLEDLKDNFDTAIATFARLPAIVDKAEAALDDYERDKRDPRRRFNRFMLLTAFWLSLAVLLLATWRLLGL